MSVFCVNPDARLDTTIGKILRKRTATTFTLASGLMKKQDAESVHQMRVSARRLNTLMKIFRDLYPEKELNAHLRILRDVLDCSGAVRECDIVLAMLGAFRDTLDRHEAMVIDLLIARKRHERAKHWKDLTQTLSRLRDGTIRLEFEKFISNPA
jgi:CHAD domain-containing protein